MKDQYNPHRDPIPADWLQADEQERIDWVKGYHRRKKIRIEGFDMHAAIHVAVENQLAEGKPANLRGTLARLMDDGLSRHEAIHAIGSLVVQGMFRASHGQTAFEPGQYERDLDALTRASWEKEYED